MQPWRCWITQTSLKTVTPARPPHRTAALHLFQAGTFLTKDQLETRQTPLYFATVLAAIAFGVLAEAGAPVLEALITPAIAGLMYAMFLQLSLIHI